MVNIKNDNLLQQISAIFKHWFTNNPELDSMTQVPLADLCAVVTKGTTPTTLGKPFVSKGINFIKAESIQDNHSIDKNKFAYIDDETNNLLKRSIISAGDIVFTIAGSLGRFAFVDDSVLPANTNQAVAIIRADTSKVTPEYLYSFFLGNWHNDYYTKRIQQAVQANLSLGTIKSLPIPVLSDQAMFEYLGLITPLIAMTKSNELEIVRLAQVRDTLLPQLMSGKLDVSNIDI
ncbi:restriction endonuclease subunit S [Lachnospiraceae bacterium C1.1]|nr:restriction endonuclease subunit S [Lachnospiraceae bacterium C1.1]